MKKDLLLSATLVLVIIPTALWGDTLVCVTTRRGNDIVDWSQLGPPGTSVPEQFTAVASGAFPLVVQGVFFPGLEGPVVEQEGNGFLGDFTVGDYLLWSYYNNDILRLQFLTPGSSPVGVSQVGAQVDPSVVPTTFPVTVVAYDLNLTELGSCTEIVTNMGHGDGSAPYLGIADATSANIYYVDFLGFDKGFALNTLSITTPGCGVPPNIGGASFKYSNVFASIGTDTSGNLGVVDEVAPVGTPMQTLVDGSGAGITTGTAFDAAGNLYITNFDKGTISKIDKAGVVTSSFATPRTDGQTRPESIRAVGILPNLSDLKLYVGGPQTCASGACILQYDFTGTLQRTILVGGAGSTGGTDWIEFLTPDILLYSGEGPEIRAYNVTTNTQLPDLISNLQSPFQFRVVRSASPGSCGVPACSLPDPYILAANGVRFGAEAVLVDPTPWLNATPIGSLPAVVSRMYTVPSRLNFSLAVDPDRLHFWTGDVGFHGSTGGTVWQVDICSGQIGYSWNTPSNSSPLSGAAGLSVWGGLGSVW